ncbi:hypothetical protein FXN61_09720 [Lentzea sp. PSKA42]|uniref:Uncharacterized protein n=1 Tax=Lentzea indica TaxID=2604800 RepID=A0ABX1FDQ2_9PSEU|nr:hypothetical protein [Lentzea indica]NKE57096.1 hypothetical protein [Lentzea indica]
MAAALARLTRSCRAPIGPGVLSEWSSGSFPACSRSAVSRASRKVSASLTPVAASSAICAAPPPIADLVVLR